MDTVDVLLDLMQRRSMNPQSLRHINHVAHAEVQGSGALDDGGESGETVGLLVSVSVFIEHCF